MTEFLESYRVVTFVPAAEAEAFAAAIAPQIPSFLGHYDSVAWWSAPLQEPGTEQARPLPGARPAAGKPGALACVPSVRMEFSLPADETALRRFIEDALRPLHPWEEPVILVFPGRIAAPPAGNKL